MRRRSARIEGFSIWRNDKIQKPNDKDAGRANRMASTYGVKAKSESARMEGGGCRTETFTPKDSLGFSKTKYHATADAGAAECSQMDKRLPVPSPSSFP